MLKLTNRIIPSQCDPIIDCSTCIISLQFCALDVWNRQIKDLKADSKIHLRYVEDVDANLEDVTREGKQFLAEYYGQNQLSSSENRCTKWKNKTVDHKVQNFESPFYRHPLPYMAIPPVLIFFPNPPLLARLFQQYQPN